MTSPYDDVPPLVEQDMSPDGVWRPQYNAFMAWFPTDDDDTIAARGPLLPQIHDSGIWAPGAGNSMTWIPAVAVRDAPVIEVVDVAGDEPQDA